MGSKSSGTIRTRRVTGWFIILGCALGWQGCSDTEKPERDALDPGKLDAGPTWGASACAACVGTGCRTELDACSRDPSCAAHLSCLRACPPGPKGDVDSACEAGCPAVSGSSAEAALAALRSCRKTGAGAACAACGGAPPDAGGDAADAGCSAHPFLCQECGGSTDPEV